MGCVLLKEFVKRNAQRVCDRWRALRLVRWLSEQEEILWMSIIKPTACALQAARPNLDSFRGLRALTEVKNGNGEIEWHFLWGTEGAAEEYESIINKKFGATKAIRAAVLTVTIPKEKLGKLWTTLTVTLASVALIMANLETINSFLLQLNHQPQMTLESRETIQVASSSKEQKEIVLLGDPFFRARLGGLTMYINPDPDYPRTAALPNGGKVSIPAWHRSVDVSQELKLRLPFVNLPAGRYRVVLRGKVHTAWRSASFKPSHSIPLDVRAPVAARKIQVLPWSSDARVGGKFPEALVDLDLLFGRPEDKILNVRVILEGGWTGWSVENLPDVTIERESQNTPQNPKSVVFALRGLQRAEFTSKQVRLRISAGKPLTAEEWSLAVPEPFAELF